MILQRPRKIVYKYQHKSRLNRISFKQNTLTLGCWGLKAVEAGRLSFNEVDAARKYIQGLIKMEGFANFNIAFNRPFTKKSLGSRMGKGKGSVADWFVYVSAGTILLELCQVSDKTATTALCNVQKKFCLKTKAVQFIF